MGNNKYYNINMKFLIILLFNTRNTFLGSAKENTIFIPYRIMLPYFLSTVTWTDNINVTTLQ